MQPSDIQRIGCIGTGVVGSGWAVHYLAHGFDVIVWDPEPRSASRSREFVQREWATVEKLGLVDGASPDRLSVVATMQDVVERAQFIQESAPERLELKRDLLRSIDAKAARDVVIASSTSGLLPTALQQGCRFPERVAVAHPFNPPFLMPLVEVVGGAETSSETMDWLVKFYERTEKIVLRLHHEVPGFIANRLQEAIWREAVQLIADGHATPEQIDTALSSGPALRWALMGPILQMQLTGGEGGVRHALDQFDPDVRRGWSYAPQPTLDLTTKNMIVEGCLRLVSGRSVQDLTAQRNLWLVSALRAQRKSKES